MNQGQRESALGDHDKARSSLTEALNLWRGQALAGLELGPQLEARATGLEELRRRALEMRIEASLAAGMHRETIGELRLLATAEPYREGLAAQLMLALYRSERRSEALEVYRGLQMILREELGIDPSPKVRKLHEAILNNDTSIDFQPRGATATAAAPRSEASLTPAQLPPDIPDFTSRTEEIARITAMLSPDATVSSERTASRVVITGMVGSGKSALAIHAAHALRQHYPDGQVYIRLRRRATPITPADALAAVLQAVGFSAIPTDLEGRSQLFRSWVADRRLLMVIDDATSADQVYPMLPTGPQSAVIITSLTPLGGLGGTETIRLSPMSSLDGVRLLTLLAGEHKISKEPEAARKLVQICGGLPLAIRICAARVTRRGWTLGQMLARLADDTERLNELHIDGLDVRDHLENGLRLLDGDELEAFRRLGIMRADTFTTTYAACELVSGVRDTERLLDRLHEASMVQLLGEDRGGEPLWHFHPLLRTYAEEMTRGRKGDVHCSVA